MERETCAEFCQISKCSHPPWDTLWSGLDADHILGDDSGDSVRMQMDVDNTDKHEPLDGVLFYHLRDKKDF